MVVDMCKDGRAAPPILTETMTWVTKTGAAAAAAGGDPGQGGGAQPRRVRGAGHGASRVGFFVGRGKHRAALTGSLPTNQHPPQPQSESITAQQQRQVFVDGVYRQELSLLGNVTGSEAWRAGSIHSFADDPELQVGFCLWGVWSGVGFGGLEWSCVYRRAFSHTQMRNPEKLNTSIQKPINQYNRQRELLAEIAWAPEVGMRHTLAAGSLPFTSLNQVGGCLFGSWCGVGGGSLAYAEQFTRFGDRRACATRPAWWCRSAWRWTRRCR